MISLLRRKRRTTARAKSTPSRTAFSLAGLAALLGGTVFGGDAIAPAPGYPQVAAYEPVFVSSSKPLPTPPATITKPVAVPNFEPVLTPTRPAPAAAAPAPSTYVALAAQVVEPPMVAGPTVSEGLRDYQIILEPPSPQELFNRLDSEKMLEKRMRLQAEQRNPPDTVRFPDHPLVSDRPYKPRALPPSRIFAEPNFVVHDRLYTEERNAERYGWSLGISQPVVSFLYFYRDVAFMPLVWASRPLQRFETSAGKCLPGDPVPYIVYPLSLSAPVKGAAFGIIAALP